MSEKALLVPINSKGEIFIQDRTGYKPPPWGFFGGSIEEGETPETAVIREAKEELDITLSPEDIHLIGAYTITIEGLDVFRSLFLYHTDQEVFTVLEGAGGYWMDVETAQNHLGDAEMFQKIIQMVKKHLNIV